MTIHCTDFNSDCPAEFTTADEKELLQHVKLHTEAVHRPMEWSPELAEVVKTHIKRAAE